MKKYAFITIIFLVSTLSISQLKANNCAGCDCTLDTPTTHSSPGVAITDLDGASTSISKCISGIIGELITGNTNLIAHYYFTVATDGILKINSSSPNNKQYKLIVGSTKNGAEYYDNILNFPSPSITDIVLKAGDSLYIRVFKFTLTAEYQLDFDFQAIEIVENAYDLCYKGITTNEFCSGSFVFLCTKTIHLTSLTDIVEVQTAINTTDFSGTLMNDCGVDGISGKNKDENTTGACRNKNSIDIGPFNFMNQGLIYNLSDNMPANTDHSFYNSAFNEMSFFAFSRLYGSYIKDSKFYRGRLSDCSLGYPVVPSTPNIIDVVDTSMYPTYAISPIIKTKVSKKGNQQLTAVNLDPVNFTETNYVATLFPQASTQALLYRSDETCTEELPLAEPVVGSPIGEPVTARIINGTSHADTNMFTMKALANKNTTIKVKYIDWSHAINRLNFADACSQNNMLEGNFKGIPRCLNNLSSGNGLPQEFKDKYPNISTLCLNQTLGTYSACDVNAYTSGGSRGGIYPEKYDHAYGCFACIVDAIGDLGTCSRDNFTIRPNHFDINAANADFPNLLRAGQDYNISVLARDYQESTNATQDYNQSKSNIDLNQTRYFSDGTSDTHTLLHGTLTWSAWDFNITNGRSNRYENMSNTEVIGVQYDDIGKITFHVEDREWAAVDINNANDPTPHDCSPEGAYVCGELNVTFIPHHFKVDTIHLRNHEDGNFTYLSDDLNMSAHVDVMIAAMNANDTITQNFRQGGLYYENPVSVELNVTDWNASLPNRHPFGNTVHLQDISIASTLGFGGSDLNGTHVIQWDEANITQRLIFNYDRRNNQAVNPFDINGTDINISVTSLYTNSSGGLATITGSGIGDRNASFLFARAKSSQFFYDNVTRGSQVTPISVQIYCDKWPASLTNCPKVDLTAEDTRHSYWWYSSSHDQVNNYGNITLKVNPASGTVSPTVVNINNGDNGIKEVTVTAGAGTLPYIVDIDFVTTNASDTSSWLLYNKDHDTIPYPFYRVHFVGTSSWTGLGKTGNIVGDDINKKKTKRVEW